MKLTNQRRTIYEFVKNNYNHPSVEDVFLNVQKKLPQISKKTVYQNLKTLTENNKIKEITINGIKRYEPIQEEHIHATCKECGKIADIKAKKLIEETEKVKKQIKEFKIETSTTTMKGLCKTCK